MPSEVAIQTGQVIPEDKGGPRVGVGAKAVCRRTTDGPITVTIWRGDGGDPEAYTYLVRAKTYGPFVANEQTTVTIAELDLALPDFTPRSFEVRVTASGPPGDIGVASALVSTEPFATAGTIP